jgi:uncharacterized protein (DUF433 family)
MEGALTIDVKAHDGNALMQLPDFLELDSDQAIGIKGHRIRLIDIASRFREGHSAEGIAFDIYPTLELSLVYKAIAFYLENQAEIDESIRQNRAEIERQAALPRKTPTTAELQRRMNVNRTREAS